MNSRTALLVAALALPAGRAVADDAVTTSSVSAPAVDTSSLTTAFRAEPLPPLDLPGLLLGLPGAFVELAFLPLEPLVTFTEKTHFHERVFDLLTNDEQTAAIAPIVEFFSSSGIGFGGAAIHNAPLGSGDLESLVVLARVNGDISASASVQRRFSSMNGRSLSLSGRYSRDQDYRYYGLDARDTTRRLLHIDAIDAELTGQILSPAESDFRLYVGLAFRRRETTTGKGDEPGLIRDGTLAIPGGFEEELHYPAASLRLELDTRDSRGRTTRGIVASLEGRLTADVEGADTSVFRGIAHVALFTPVLPLHRVLYLSLGASAAVPLGTDAVPLHELVHLGGASSLRGYDSDRFTGAVGWWGTAEYRYKVFQEADTGHGISSVIFFDVGATSHNVEQMLFAPVRWSAGFALRVETNLFLLGRLQLGFSPEGVQVTAAIGELL